MDDHKKLEFVHAMTKMGLKHYDAGGVISAGNSNPLSGVAGALTAQNSYQAGSPTGNAAIGEQQAGLANQLQTESAGGGPNPAQSQYLQNSNNIAQQQAATYAGNRALNPALAARMAGNTGAQTQQQAASTAGIQQAQQQLAAQAQLEGLTGQEQAGSLASQQINAGISQNNANSVNQQQQGLISGALGSLPVIGSLLAKGGKVEKPAMMAGGGSIQPMQAPQYQLPVYGVDSNMRVAGNTKSPFSSAGGGSLLSGFLNKSSGANPATALDNSTWEGGGSSGTTFGIAGGSMDAGGASAMLPAAAMAAQGGLMKAGGPVMAGSKNQKAIKSGDSYSNDKIPAMLSEGELVIDRDTMNDKGPMGQMARALAMHIQARNGKKQ